MSKSDKLIKTDIENIVKNLSNKLNDPDDVKYLENLKKEAIDGIVLKKRFRRFILGVSLTDAIDNWLSEFNPTFGKPLAKQIPKEETKQVVTAWIRLSFYRTLIIFFLSSFISITTVFFLYMQISKQDEMIRFQRDISYQEKIISYVKILYSKKCTLIEEEKNGKTSIKEHCNTQYHSRVRREALVSFIKIDRNLEDVYLSDVNLSRIDMSNINLKFGNLISSDLTSTKFNNTNLESAVLSWSDLSNASLKNANLNRAILLNVKNLTCEQLTEARNWEESIREYNLKCGSEKELSVPSILDRVNAM